jgi:hypothetical protein
VKVINVINWVFYPAISISVLSRCIQLATDSDLFGIIFLLSTYIAFGTAALLVPKLEECLNSLQEIAAAVTRLEKATDAFQEAEAKAKMVEKLGAHANPKSKLPFLR